MLNFAVIDCLLMLEDSLRICSTRGVVLDCTAAKCAMPVKNLQPSNGTKRSEENHHETNDDVITCNQGLFVPLKRSPIACRAE